MSAMGCPTHPLVLGVIWMFRGQVCRYVCTIYLYTHIHTKVGISKYIQNPIHMGALVQIASNFVRRLFGFRFVSNRLHYIHSLACYIYFYIYYIHIYVRMCVYTRIHMCWAGTHAKQSVRLLRSPDIVYRFAKGNNSRSNYNSHTAPPAAVGRSPAPRPTALLRSKPPTSHHPSPVSVLPPLFFFPHFLCQQHTATHTHTIPTYISSDIQTSLRRRTPKRPTTDRPTDRPSPPSACSAIRHPPLS